MNMPAVFTDIDCDIAAQTLADRDSSFPLNERWPKELIPMRNIPNYSFSIAWVSYLPISRYIPESLGIYLPPTINPRKTSFRAGIISPSPLFPKIMSLLFYPAIYKEPNKVSTIRRFPLPKPSARLGKPHKERRGVETENLRTTKQRKPTMRTRILTSSNPISRTSS